MQGQTLGEDVAIAGTPFTLNYTSGRSLGQKADYSLDISLSGASVPASLKQILLDVTVAGRQFEKTFAPTPNQSYTFVWDGQDAYGRTVQGAQETSVRIGYVYGAVYNDPSTSGNAFGALSGIPITGSRARQEVVLWQEWQEVLGAWDSRGRGPGGLGPGYPPRL